MRVKTGDRLRSVVCATEVIAVKADESDVDLRCGGQPMVAHDSLGDPTGHSAQSLAGGTLLGKRYTIEGQTIEVLVTKGGAGTLSIGDQPLAPKDAKKLPSTD